MGEKNTGNPNTLSSFVNWGLNTFTADKYTLFLWSHGYTWEGCCPDVTSGGDKLTINELKTCWPCQSGDIDLIGFVCCGVQTSELIYQFKKSINPKVIVAPEWLTSCQHWNFDAILNYLKNTPTCTANQFGKKMVEIYVTNTPGVLTETVADLTFGLILSVARNITSADRYIRTGTWHGWGPKQFLGVDVYGKTLGIVGLGRIGYAVAKRARGFNMKLLFYDVYRNPEHEKQYGLTFISLDRLLQQSDYVTIHVPLLP